MFYICVLNILFTKMNSTEIVSRLKIVLKHYNLTSSTFADTIDVQRSSISHLMSGRNKPSLDFILKVVDKYPDVDLYWLLNGKGVFPKVEENKKIIKSLDKPIIKKNEIIEKKESPSPSLFSQNQSEQEKEIIPEKILSVNTKKLIKVVLLYSDGSFEEFNQ